MDAQRIARPILVAAAVTGSAIKLALRGEVAVEVERDADWIEPVGARDAGEAEERGEDRRSAPAVAVDVNEHDPGAERDGAVEEHLLHTQMPPDRVRGPGTRASFGT